LRLSTRPQKEQLRDWGIELDVLTVGQSRLLKLVYRLTNLRGTEQALMVASDVAASLGTFGKEVTLVGDGLQQRPVAWGMYTGGQTWGALTNEGSGRTLVMVGAQPDVNLYHGGLWGSLLGSEQEIRVSGAQTRELVYYLVIADSLAEAHDYTALAQY
jgi:hypothetical protein